MFLSLLFAIAVAAPPDDRPVLDAVLASYAKELGVSEIVLHPRTIAPRNDSLKLRVSSPANREAALNYRALPYQMTHDLIRRSMKSVDLMPPQGYVAKKGERGECGFAEAGQIGLSRPGYEESFALVYLEGHAQARAYYLQKTGDEWRVLWHVELWACG